MSWLLIQMVGIGSNPWFSFWHVLLVLAIFVSDDVRPCTVLRSLFHDAFNVQLRVGLHVASGA